MAGKKKIPDTETVNEEKVENKFSKEQLVDSNHFRERRDILAALLNDGGLYTVNAVEEKIESYMKGKVK